MHPKSNPNCETVWTAKENLEKWQKISFAVLYSTTGLGALLCNLLVIVSLYKTKQLNNTFNVLILCHSIADSCLAVIGQTHIAVTLTNPTPSCTFEIITQFLSYFFPHVSALLISAMAVGRMIYIKYSKNIIYRLNRVKLCFILFCCIFLAFSTGMSYTLATIYGVYHQVNITILTADMIVSLIGLLSYLCLYRKVISHVKNSSKIVRCRSAMHQQKYKQIYSDAVSMTKTINQIIIVLCISYFPYVTIGLVYSSQPHICNKQ